MTETIQTLKEDIAVLQEKLQKLEKQQQPKSPVEEAYKDWMGVYPPTNPSVDNISDIRWRAFQMGYNAAYEEIVSEEPAKDVVSLYKRFENEGAYGQIYYDDALKVVKSFLMDECVIKCEDEEYITITLQKSLLNVPND